jgi:predicted nucleotidyltransferase
MLTINEIRDAVLVIAPKYPIHSVKLFGSYADGSATDKSDVDIIIYTVRPFTLFDLIGFQQDLMEHLHTGVDVIEAKSLTESELVIERTVDLFGGPETARLGVM